LEENSHGGTNYEFGVPTKASEPNEEIQVKAQKAFYDHFKWIGSYPGRADQ
jgi:hypothetical protein